MTQEESYLKWKVEQLEKIEKYSSGKQYIDKNIYKNYSPTRDILCDKCNNYKHASLFYIRESKNGLVLQRPCKECVKKYQQSRKEVIRENNLKRIFNLSREDYNKLLEEQNNSCKICKQHKSSFLKELAVDHCHNTGKVRGLLCNQCNAGLGHFRDNIDLLKEGIIYLEISRLQNN